MFDSTETRSTAFRPGFRKYTVIFLAFCFLAPVFQFTVLPSDKSSSETAALVVGAVVFLYFFKLNAHMRGTNPENGRLHAAKQRP